MEELLVAAALLLSLPTSAAAQQAEHQYCGQGYGFVAGEATVGAAGGAGGEVFINNGVALGGEFVKAENPFGEYSGTVNMYYHFGASTDRRKIEPFLTGGYTWFYISNVQLSRANGANFGAGLNIWAFKHAALRLEVRDTIGGRDISIDYEPYGTFYTAPNNVVSFRLGLTFR